MDYLQLIFHMHHVRLMDKLINDFINSQGEKTEDFHL